MGTNFDLAWSNPSKFREHFYGPFHRPLGLAYSPLNSAKLSCSSEVTLRGLVENILCMHIVLKVSFDILFLHEGDWPSEILFWLLIN